MEDFNVKRIRVVATDENGVDHEFIPKDEVQFEEDLYLFMEDKGAMDNFDGDVS